MHGGWGTYCEQRPVWRESLLTKDAEALLRRIGAWDTYGTHPIFPKEKILVKRRIKKELELPAVQHVLQDIYGCDYLNPHFNFSN